MILIILEAIFVAAFVTACLVGGVVILAGWFTNPERISRIAAQPHPDLSGTVEQSGPDNWTVTEQDQTPADWNNDPSGQVGIGREIDRWGDARHARIQEEKRINRERMAAERYRSIPALRAKLAKDGELHRRLKDPNIVEAEYTEEG